MNELIEINTCKTKIYGFVQPLRTKSKAIVNNSTKSVILFSYTDVKDKLNFPDTAIGFILKKTDKQSKAVRKAVVKFVFPRQILMLVLE